MAKKVLLKDHADNYILPITRGEFILDSSGKQAFKSEQFLASTSQPGLMSSEDKKKIDNVQTDDSLSTTSANPVQNKVVTSAINKAQADATDAKTTANANKEELTKTQQILNAIKTSYLKSVSVSGNTLTIKDQNDSEVEFYNTTYEIVSSSSNGLAPAIGTSVSSIIGNQADEWVLTSTKGEAPTWRKLPANAFLNNNDNTTYTLEGRLEDNTFISTLKPSSGTNTSSTVPAMVAASASEAGKAGLVPAPAKGDQNKFLSGAGTWNTLPSLYVTNEETGNAITDVEVSGHGITLKRGTVFSIDGHEHSTEDITALTGYTKATSESALSVTDSMNIALGKLEYKADLGKTAYDWYRSVTDADTDKYINKWQEILDFLLNVDNTEGADIIDEFVTRKTPQTITGAKTFQSDSDGVALTLWRNLMSGGFYTALNFITGSNRSVPTSSIRDFINNPYSSGGVLQFLTQQGNTDTSATNHNNLVLRMSIDDYGKVLITNTSENGGGALTVNGSARLFDTFIEYNDEINRYGGDLYIQHRGSSDALGSQGNSLTHNIIMTANGGKVGIGGFRSADMTADYKLWIYGDTYTTGWNRAKDGFFVEGSGIHYMANGSGIGQIYLSGNNEMNLSTSTTNGIWYFNYRAPSFGNVPTRYIWNAGSSTTYASHTMNTWTTYGALNNIQYTTGNTDIGIKVKGSSKEIGYILGSGNINYGIYDYSADAWMIYKDSTRVIIPTWKGVGSSTTAVYFNSTGYPVAGSDVRYVLQEATTTTNYRPLVLGYTSTTTTSSLAATVTNKVYVSTLLYVKPSAGAIYCNASYQASDLNLKNIIKPLKVDLDKLSKLRKIYYTWKDSSSDTNLQIGMIAQDVESVYPELVSKNANETLSLSYDRLSVIALEGLDVLYQENKELRNRLDKLEKLVSNK